MKRHQLRMLLVCLKDIKENQFLHEAVNISTVNKCFKWGVEASLEANLRIWSFWHFYSSLIFSALDGSAFLL